jgi:hypothetical protein
LLPRALESTSRIHLALFGMQNRTFGPYLLDGRDARALPRSAVDASEVQ